MDATIKVFGQSFKKGMFILFKKINKSEFAFIKDIVIIKDKGSFYIQEFETLGFYSHYHSYYIKEKNNCNLIEINALAHYHPLNKNINLAENDQRIFIRPLCFIHE